MIQRRQTLFLLCSIILMVGFLFSPVVRAEWMGGSVDLYGYEMKKTIDVPSMGRYHFFVNEWFVAILAGFNLIAILLYKYRRPQMVLALLGILPCIAAFVYDYWAWSTTEGIHDTIFFYGNITPWAAIIFNVLAWWAIRSDEQLVQSMDRLR